MFTNMWSFYLRVYIILPLSIVENTSAPNPTEAAASSVDEGSMDVIVIIDSTAVPSNETPMLLSASNSGLA